MHLENFIADLHMLPQLELMSVALSNTVPLTFCVLYLEKYIEKNQFKPTYLSRTTVNAATSP